MQVYNLHLLRLNLDNRHHNNMSVPHKNTKIENIK